MNNLVVKYVYLLILFGGLISCSGEEEKKIVENEVKIDVSDSVLDFDYSEQQKKLLLTFLRNGAFTPQKIGVLFPPMPD